MDRVTQAPATPASPGSVGIVAAQTFRHEEPVGLAEQAGQDIGRSWGQGVEALP